MGSDEGACRSRKGLAVALGRDRLGVGDVGGGGKESGSVVDAVEEGVGLVWAGRMEGERCWLELGDLGPGRWLENRARYKVPWPSTGGVWGGVCLGPVSDWRGGHGYRYLTLSKCRMGDFTYYQAGGGGG